MERFLEYSARYVYNKHKGDLSEISLVFPNRRSGVFFTSYLQKNVNKSLICPEVITINEFFNQFAEYQVADKLQLIAILYSVFKKHTHTTETFDEFYFWGEILLSDFNDIDRYLVDAKDLFTNISDLKQLESLFDYLTGEQKKALEYFWGSVSLANSKEFQKKYLHIWEKLFPVYRDFKQILANNKMAFAGMNSRLVIEKINAGEIDFSSSKYYFVGLNALNTCEKKMFSFLQRQKKAAFLWDYDEFYVNDHKKEAGWFLRENLKLLPPPEDFNLNSTSFQAEKNVEIIAVSSVYGQSQIIPGFLKEKGDALKNRFDNTAVILADESLLFSSLSAIPDSIEKINVTMGYPVRSSVIYGFLMLLIQLLKNKRTNEKNKTVVYHRFVTDILKHQLLFDFEAEKVENYIREINTNNRITVDLQNLYFSDLHRIIFSPPEEIDGFSKYFLEILKFLFSHFNQKDEKNQMLLELIYTVYQSVEKLQTAIIKLNESEKQSLSELIYFRLLTQYLGGESVAFEGEPLSGMQLMGILETRCLDFDNLIILGLNENVWPRVFTAPSFLPFNIRKGFGLPGIDEQDAMYAYYFYRLIQRAKNITATYSVAKEGMGTGELSRYGYQLKYDSKLQVNFTNLLFSFANEPAKRIAVQNTEEDVRNYLQRITKKHPLSPSAINTYLHCSLRFWFRYYMQIPEPEEIKDEIDSPVFGSIFHEVMERLYKPFIGKSIEKQDIENIRKNKILIQNELTRAIQIHYFKDKKLERKIKLEGKTHLIFDNAKTFLLQLLQIDKNNAPFYIESLEKQYKTRLNVNVDGLESTVDIGGKIDRVDLKNEVVRILDYKTGKVDQLSFKELEELFDREKEKPKKEILQALVYSYVFNAENNQKLIQPAVYSLKELFKEPFDPLVKWDKKDIYYHEVQESFKKSLKILVEEILSVKTVFSQTKHENKCEYCPYNRICQRYKI